MYLTLNHPVPANRFGGDALDTFVNELFGDFLARPRRNDRRADTSVARARLDVVEKEECYDAFFELPGVNKENVEINIDGAYVSVHAQAKHEENLKEGERVLCCERSTMSWERCFQLPTEVDEQRAKATYENGVLKLTLPKKKKSTAKRLTIQ